MDSSIDQLINLEKNIGRLYEEIFKFVKDVPEKRLVLEKIAEAGMWMKLLIDLEKPIEHKIHGELKDVTVNPS